MQTIKKAVVRMSDELKALNNHTQLLDNEWHDRLFELCDLGLEGYGEMLREEMYVALDADCSYEGQIRALVNAINDAQSRIDLERAGPKSEEEIDQLRFLIDWEGDGVMH